MAKSTATLTDNETGKSYEFPIIHGTVGPRLVDIRKMYGESDMFTYDPGFTSTGSCGSNGLQHRRAGRAERSHGGVLSPDEGRAAQQGAEGKVRPRHHASHHGAR